MGKRSILTPGQRREARRKAVLVEFEKNPNQFAVSVARKLSLPVKLVRHWWSIFPDDVSCKDQPRSGARKQLASNEVATALKHINFTAHGTIRTATELTNQKRAAAGDRQVCEKTVRRAVKAGKTVAVYGKIRREKVSAKNAELREQATTAAAIRKAKRKLRVLVFQDAAQVSWHPTKGLIKAFRVPQGWNDPKQPRPQILGSWKVMKYYAAVCLDSRGVVQQIHQEPSKHVQNWKGL